MLSILITVISSVTASGEVVSKNKSVLKNDAPLALSYFYRTRWSASRHPLGVLGRQYRASK